MFDNMFDNICSVKRPAAAPCSTTEHILFVRHVAEHVAEHDVGHVAGHVRQHVFEHACRT